MAEILADIELTSSHTLTGSFADITGMSAMVDIAGTGSVVLLLMSLTPDAGDDADETGEYRFTVDGGAVGAESTSFKDATDAGGSCTLAFAVDGLSTGPHTFAVQGANIQGTVPMSTTRVRLFQVVEITTGASIVVDISSTSADNSVVAWTTIEDMTDTITAVAGRAYLMFGTNPPDMTSAGDNSANHSFGVGGVREGPVIHNARDNVDEAEGVTLVWVATGVSGSTVFDFQWINFAGFMPASEVRPRIFQVIELESTIFDLLTDITSVTADTIDSTLGVFTVVDDMTDSPTVAGTGSVVIKLFCMQFLRGDGQDDVVAYRLRTDSSQVGAEIVQDGDDDDRTAGQALIHAETGLSGSTAFDAQWAQIATAGDDATTNEDFNRTFQVLELLDGGIPDVTGVGVCVAPAHDVQGTGEEVFEGTGTCVASAHDVQGTGEEVFEGTGTCVAPAHDVQGTGEEVFEGSGTCVAPAHDVQGTGTFTETITGVGACVAPAHDVQGTGEEIFEGTGTCVAPAHDVQGTGEEIFEGSGACVAPAHDVEGTGTFTELITGVGACVAPAHDVEGTGEEVFEGTGTCVAPAHDVQGTGTFIELITGSGACVAPAHDVQGTGEEVFEGAATCVAAAHDVQGTGEEIFEGASACVAPAHDVQGTGEEIFEGSGACVAPAHDVQGTGTFIELITGAGACVAPAHDVQGTGEEVFEGAATCVAAAHDVEGIGIVILNLPGQAVVVVEHPPCPFVNVFLDSGASSTRVDRPCPATLVITRPV